MALGQTQGVVRHAGEVVDQYLEEGQRLAVFALRLLLLLPNLRQEIPQVDMAVGQALPVIRNGRNLSRQLALEGDGSAEFGLRLRLAAQIPQRDPEVVMASSQFLAVV